MGEPSEERPRTPGRQRPNPARALLETRSKSQGAMVPVGGGDEAQGDDDRES